MLGTGGSALTAIEAGIEIPGAGFDEPTSMLEGG